MVTAELAVALPLLVLLSFVGVLAVGVGQARLRCVDAAAEAARAVARGDAGSAARLARSAAGRPVTLTRSSNGKDTVVTVRMTLASVGWLPSITLSETATAATEPSAPTAPP
jgi:Flp pilus assembly protein TadG